jgi:hypothetical protein
VSDLFLSDDPPPRRARPRWLDALGLAAVVGAMVAVGVLGDRGGRDDRATPTTSSTTTTTSPFRRGRPFAPTTTAPTTTAELTPISDRPTGALLGTSDGGQFAIVDVDRQRVTTVPFAGGGMGVLGTPAGFVLAGQGRFVLWPAGGGEPTEVQATVDDATPLFGEGDRFWAVHPEGDGTTATEHRLDGTTTGTLVHVPGGSTIVGTWAEGLVVSGGGALTAVVANDDALHELGTGDYVASRGHQLARVRCPLLRCSLEVVNVPSGKARRLPGAPVEGVFTGTFSPDGRWLAYVLGRQDATEVVVVDLSSGAVSRSESLTQTYAQVAFAPDSRTLFRMQEAQLCATRLDTGTTTCSPAPVHPYGAVGVAPAPDR